MLVLVLAAEAEETRQTVTLLIVCLIGVAAALAALTVWYWFFTDPRRELERVGEAGDVGPAVRDEVAELAGATEVAATESEKAIETAAIETAAIDLAPGDRVPARHGATGSTSVDADSSEAVPVVAGPVGDAGDQGNEAEAMGETGDEVVADPVTVRQTLDFVAAARRAEEGPAIRSPELPTSHRILVEARGEKAGGEEADDEGGDGDELAVIRRRRERETARGLSDEMWEAVRRSAFKRLDG